MAGCLLASFSFGIISYLIFLTVEARPVNPYGTTHKPFHNGRCFFPCSADIYGLGIRLGIYLQWLGTYVANRYCPEAIGELLDTNTLFLFALLVATILVSVQEDDIHPVEIMVVLYIMFGGLASIFTIKGYRTLLTPRHPTDFHFSLFGIMVRTYLRAAISAYAIWFLFSGIYEFAPAPCSSDIFFFARLDLMGNVLYLFKAFAVLCTGYDACGLIASLWHSSVPTKLWSALLPWFTIKKLYSLVRCKKAGEVSFKLLLARLWAVYSLPAHRVTNQDSPHQVPKKISICLWKIGLKLSFLAPVAPIVIIIWSIVAIELTLSWNNISGIYDVSPTGQIIPLVIGGLSLVRLLQIFFAEHLAKHKWHPHRYEVIRLKNGSHVTFELGSKLKRSRSL